MSCSITLKGGTHEHADCRARWEGMVIGAALIAWAEAIRTRPHYTWKVVVSRGPGKFQTVAWFSDEALAREHAEAMSKHGIHTHEITRVEIDHDV